MDRRVAGLTLSPDTLSRSLGGGRGVRGLATLFAVSLALAPAAATAAPTASAVSHAAGRALHAGAFRAGDLDGLHAAVGLALLDDVFHGLVLFEIGRGRCEREAQLITVISRTAGSWKSKLFRAHVSGPNRRALPESRPPRPTRRRSSTSIVPDVSMIDALMRARRRGGCRDASTSSTARDLCVSRRGKSPGTGAKRDATDEGCSGHWSHLAEGAEAVAVNGGLVDENLLGSVVGGDEAEALLGVEPFDLRGRAKAGEGSRERKPGKFTGAISFIATP